MVSSGARKRYIIIFAALFSIMAVFLGVTYVHFNKFTNIFIEEKTNEKLAQYAVQQTKYVETVLDGQFSALESMASFLGRHERTDTRDFTELALSAEECMDFSRLVVADRDGSSLSSDGLTGNQAYREYFQQALAGARAISKPIISGFDETYNCVVLAVPLKTQDGEIRGVLSGSYTAERFGDLLMENNYWEDADSYIVDAKGDIVVSSVDGSISFGGKSWPEGYSLLGGVTVEDVLDAMEQGASLTYRVVADGVEYCATVTPFGYNGWSFFSMTPASEVDASYAVIKTNAKWLNMSLGIVFLVCLDAVLMVLLRERQSLREEAELLRSRARIDAMTGLYNKSAAEALARLALLEDRLQTDALVICDLDGLKAINDGFGHAEGDKAIRALAFCIKSRFRARDVLGRIGGDEFLILLRGVESEDYARGALETLRKNVSDVFVGEERKQKLHVSMGVCLTSGGEEYDEVCRRADTALYHVKNGGKNAIAFYSPGMEPPGGGA